MNALLFWDGFSHPQIGIPCKGASLLLWDWCQHLRMSFIFAQEHLRYADSFSLYTFKRDSLVRMESATRGMAILGTKRIAAFASFLHYRTRWSHYTFMFRLLLVGTPLQLPEGSRETLAVLWYGNHIQRRHTSCTSFLHSFECATLGAHLSPLSTAY